MGEPIYAASELRSVLPERLSAWLNWSTLRKGPADYVTEEMRVRFGDLLFEVDSRDGAALIYVAMEHQSSSDELMPFRMIEYLTQIWARHLRKAKPRPRRLPVVIPLVVHIGSQGAGGVTRHSSSTFSRYRRAWPTCSVTTCRDSGSCSTTSRRWIRQNWPSARSHRKCG